MADGGMADATPDEGVRGYTSTGYTSTGYTGTGYTGAAAIHKVKIPALPEERRRTGHPAESEDESFTTETQGHRECL